MPVRMPVRPENPRYSLVTGAAGAGAVVLLLGVGLLAWAKIQDSPRPGPTAQTNVSASTQSSATPISEPTVLERELLSLSSENEGLELALTSWGKQVPIGSELTFKVSSGRLAHLVLFVLSRDGSISCLYPSRYRPAVKVEGGSVLLLPSQVDRDAGFELVASPPVGLEVAFVLSSSRPLPGVPLGDDSQGWFTVYPFTAAAESPAHRFAAWIADLRKTYPDETSLNALQFEVIER